MSRQLRKIPVALQESCPPRRGINAQPLPSLRRGGVRGGVSVLALITVQNPQPLAANGTIHHQRVWVILRFLESLVKRMVYSLTSYLLPLTSYVVKVYQCQPCKREYVRRLAPVAVEQHAHGNGRKRLLLQFLVGLRLAQHGHHLAVGHRLALHAAVPSDEPQHLVHHSRHADNCEQVLEEAHPLLL